MSENKEVPVLLTEEEINLQSGYILKFLYEHLTDVKLKSKAKLFKSDELRQLLSNSFIEVNNSCDFRIGDNSFTVDRTENPLYMEVAFTMFPSRSSEVISEGLRYRKKRALSSKTFIEYHRRNKQESQSLTEQNTPLTVERAIDFISSIS